MAVISDRVFEELVNKFRNNSEYEYNQPVNDLLGEGKWTNSDVKKTISRLLTFQEIPFTVETYYSEADKNTKYEGRLWIKIFREHEVLQSVTETDEKKPVRYFKRNLYYVFEYMGDIKTIPAWINEHGSIVPTGRPYGEFKLKLSDDDWILVQERDTIVLDVEKQRFTVYDNPKEVKRLFISEKEIGT